MMPIDGENRASILTWYEQFSWCTISVHHTESSHQIARDVYRSHTVKMHSIRRRRECPCEERGFPQIKMDAVSAVSTCAMALPWLARSGAELFSSGNWAGRFNNVEPPLLWGKGRGWGARSSLAQSANYVIDTKEKRSVRGWCDLLVLYEGS